MRFYRIVKETFSGLFCYFCDCINKPTAKTMNIRLHGEITDPVTKQMNLMWGIDDGSVSFKDINEAIASKAADDKEIKLSINCPGGSVIEGFAIYDLFRSLEGHTITAETIGECSSMASIIFLSASVRRAHPNSRFCIHKPRYMDYYTETMTEDEARRIYDDLHAETERLKKIYLERTTMTEEELETLMAADKYITAEQALQYGIVTEIIQPMTALKQPTHMSKFTKALKAFMAEMREAENEQETAVVAMTLNTEDGSTIEIEREEGDPQVGDAATPDGEHKMADGTTIVIADGVITEIRPAEADEEEAMTEEEMAEAIAQMTESIEALTAENEELKKQLNASKANEKTAEDSKVLELVANAGGLKWLESLKSNHKPASREVKTARKEMTSLDERLDKKKESLKQQRNG